MRTKENNFTPKFLGNKREQNSNNSCLGEQYFDI